MASRRGWLRVERLPAYVPELNPVEGVGNVKGTGLANRRPDTMGEAIAGRWHRIRTGTGLEHVRSDVDLCFALLRRTGLSL